MIMTTKPKTRKAPAANGAELDPVFAAITEHKVLIKESDRLEDSFMTAMAKAEKKYGKWARAPDHQAARVKQPSHRFTIDGTAPIAPSARLLCEWPGRN